MAREVVLKRVIVEARPVGGWIEIGMPCCRLASTGERLPHQIKAEPLYPNMLVQCPHCRFLWVLKQIEGWAFTLEWPFLKESDL